MKHLLCEEKKKIKSLGTFLGTSAGMLGPSKYC